MPREQTTGLVLTDAFLEWTALETGRDRNRPVQTGSNRVSLVSAPLAEEVEPGEAERAARDTFVRACAGTGPDVALALASPDLMLRVVRLPDADPGEMAGMVELQVDKISPFPIESLVVSHEVLRRQEGMCDVLLAAVRTEIVDGIGSRLAGAAVETARVDAAPLGWCRLLEDEGRLEKSGREIALILEKDAAAEILVFDDGVPVMFRSLPDGADDPEALAGDVAYTLLSLEMEHGDRDITAVDVWHRDEAPANLAMTLTRSCGCTARLHSLDSLPALSEGIARRSLTGSNLLDLTPPAWRSREQARAFRKRIIVAAASLAAVWLVLVGALLLGVHISGMRLARLQAESEEASGPATEVRALRRRVSMIKRYMDADDSPLECLREITLVVPLRGLTLTSFTYRKGESLTIAGEAAAAAAVYRFKADLDASALFDSVALRGPSRNPRTRKETFTCDIGLPGGET